jgi:hypothetical protein
MQSTCQSPKATPKYHANCPCNLLTPRAALMPPCSEPSPPLSWGVYFPAIAHSQYNSVAALQSVWLCSILYLRCQGPEIFLTRVFGNHLVGTGEYLHLCLQSSSSSVFLWNHSPLTWVHMIGLNLMAQKPSVAGVFPSPGCEDLCRHTNVTQTSQ